MAIERQRKDASFDYSLRLKDAGLIAADGITQVDGANRILDLGVGRFDGRVIIDATVVEVASGTEAFVLVLEHSDSATFASGIRQGAMFAIADASAAVMLAADADNGVGRYEMPFTNEFNGATFRYLRMQVDVSGDVATGVNFTANVVKA